MVQSVCSERVESAMSLPSSEKGEPQPPNFESVYVESGEGTPSTYFVQSPAPGSMYSVTYSAAIPVGHEVASIDAPLQDLSAAGPPPTNGALRPGDDFTHCCCAFFCSVCYMAGCCIQGGRVNSCGALTLIVLCVLSMCLSLLDLMVSLASLVMMIWATPYGYLGAPLEFGFPVVTLAIAATLGIYVVLERMKLMRGEKANITHFDVQILLIISGLYAIEALIGAFLLTIASLAMSWQVAAQLDSVAMIVCSLVATSMTLWWSLHYYSRLRRIRNVNSLEVDREALEQLNDFTMYDTVQTGSGWEIAQP